MDVHNACLDVVLVLEDPRRAHRLGHRGTAGDDGDVLILVPVLRPERVLEGVLEVLLLAAETDDVGPSPLVRGLLVGDDRRRLAREADVLRALHLEEQVLGRSLGLDRVARNLHVHVREAAHLEELLERLVSGPVGTDRDAAVRAGDHHVELAVADGRAKLVEVPSRGKDAVGPEDRELAFPCETGRDAGARLLGDAHREPAVHPLGVVLVELADGDRAGDVGSQAHDALVVAVVCESASEALAGRVHVDLHVRGLVPEVVLRELRLLGFELLLRLLLVLLGQREHALDGYLLLEPELSEALPHLVDAGRLAVPAGDVLHEVDALALRGVRQDQGRLALDALRLLKGAHDLGHVVAVDLEHLPIERAVLVDERIDVHDVFHPPVDLEPVLVDDAADVVEAIVPGLHRGLPDLAFLLLAVTHQAVDAVVPLVEPRGESAPDGERQALTERAGRRLDAPELQPVRMALVRSVKLPQAHDVLDVEETGHAESDVERGSLVADRPVDAVAIGPLGLLRIVLGDVKVERRRDVHDRQRAARMTRAGRGQRDEVIAAHLVRGLGQLLDRVGPADLSRLRVTNRHGSLSLPVTPSRACGTR